MKLKIYHLFMILLLSIAVSAQSTRVMNSFEYDKLVKANKLPEKFILENRVGNNTVISPRLRPSGNMTLSNATCNCLIPLDSTFSVVPFDGSGGSGGPGVAPDYRNDDWSSVEIMLPFSFCFFGATMNSFYINNNGNISFLNPYSTFTANSFPDASFIMVGPFWGDVDTRGALSGLVYYKVTPTSVVLKWEHVGYFPNADNKLNTFQLIFTDGTDPLLPNGNNTAFCYGDMQWTTGGASGGNNGFGGTPATAGANRGNGVDYIQFGLFDSSGNYSDGPYGLNDGVDWLDSSSFVFDLCSSNVPPIPFDCNNDTVSLLVGQVTPLDFSFLAAEIFQSATITVNAGSLLNLTTFSNTPGNLAHYLGELTADASNIGYNQFSLAVTDNGTPPQTTTFNRIFYIDNANGISVNNTSSAISFSPNPFSDQTILTISGPPRKNVSIQISDVTGRVVKRMNDISTSQIIDRGNLAKGVYSYHVTDGDRLNESGKLIIR